RCGCRPSACRSRLRPEAREEAAVRGEMFVHVTEARAHRVELEVGRAHRAERLCRARELVVAHPCPEAALEADLLRIASRGLHPLPELRGSGGPFVRRREVREEPV